MNYEERDVPAAAFRFASESVDLEGGEADSPTASIRMVARSGQPIEEHWYFGKIVHDMSGFKLHKSILPIDYIHEEEIGFLDHFEVDEQHNLIVSGKLVTTSSSDDRARKVIERAKGGVPYEASIDWSGDGSVIEQIPDGFSAEVNGYQFEGPGYIVRQWPLRGVAVCPYGADMHTESTLLAKSKKPEMLRCRFINANPTKEQNEDTNSMSDIATEQEVEAVVTDEIKDEVVADSTTEDATEVPVEAAALNAARQEAKRFVDVFGDRGALMFAEGLTFDQARDREFAELRKENADLKAKLAARRPEGEENPVTFTSGEGKGSRKLASLYTFK